MSFKPDMEPLKPDAKFIKGNLDLLSKYESDLEFLKNGKMTIERQMAEKGIADDVVDKKLAKLTKSITKLESMVRDYRNQIEKAQEELDDITDDVEEDIEKSEEDDDSE